MLIHKSSQFQVKLRTLLHKTLRMLDDPCLHNASRIFSITQHAEKGEKTTTAKAGLLCAASTELSTAWIN